MAPVLGSSPLAQATQSDAPRSHEDRERLRGI